MTVGVAMKQKENKKSEESEWTIAVHQPPVIARNAMTRTQRLLVTFYFFSVDRFV